ncbi:MAG: hypothetical protein WCX69_00320 [Candidatus Paceibacterota bacterium]
MKQKKIYFVIGAIAMACFCAAGYFIFKEINNTDKNQSSGIKTNPIQNNMDTKTYRDDDYGYEIYYPSKFNSQKKSAAIDIKKSACGQQLGISTKIATDDNFNSPVYEFAVYSNLLKLPLKDFFTCQAKANIPGFDESKIKNIRAFNIGKQNIPALGFWMENLSNYILAAYGGNVYEFKLDKNDNIQGVSEEFDNILANINFTEGEIQKFCYKTAKNKYENGLAAFSLPIKSDLNGTTEVFTGCITEKETAAEIDWPIFKNIAIHHLVRASGDSYQSVWNGVTNITESTTANSFGWVFIDSIQPATDIDNDGQNEIVLSGIRNKAEKCAQYCQDWCLYSPAAKNTFCVSKCDGWSNDVIGKFTRENCIPAKTHLLAPNNECTGEKYSMICVETANLENVKYKIYRDYLEKESDSSNWPEK